MRIHTGKKKTIKCNVRFFSQEWFPKEELHFHRTGNKRLTFHTYGKQFIMSSSLCVYACSYLFLKYDIQIRYIYTYKTSFHCKRCRCHNKDFLGKCFVCVATHNVCGRHDMNSLTNDCHYIS